MIFAVALGSNQTVKNLTSVQILDAAIEKIAAAGIEIRQRSSIYRTPAFPIGSGPDFANAAILVDSPMTPNELLSLLHQIEADFQRARKTRWAPRTLDLDLIFAGDHVLPDRETWQHWHDLDLAQASTQTPHELLLPHPRMHERAFVLGPLLDLNYDWIHPILGKTIPELWQFLDPEARDEIRKMD